MRLKSCIVLTLLASLLFALPSKAHDKLIEIEPSLGAVVTQGHFEAKLTFNSPLLVVAGKTNAELATKLVGAANWVNHEVVVLNQELTAQISLSEAGDYELRWKVVSSDGHPISGDSTFTLEIESAVGQEDLDAPILIAPVPTAEQGSDGNSMVGFYIGLAMVILGVIFAPIGLMIRRQAKKS